MGKKTDLIQFLADPELARRIRREAERRGLSVSAYCRWAVISFLDNHGKTDEIKEEL